MAVCWKSKQVSSFQILKWYIDMQMFKYLSFLFIWGWVDQVHGSYSVSPGLSSCTGSSFPTEWAHVSMIWRAETEVSVFFLCLWVTANKIIRIISCDLSAKKLTWWGWVVKFFLFNFPSAPSVCDVGIHISFFPSFVFLILTTHKPKNDIRLKFSLFFFFLLIFICWTLPFYMWFTDFVHLCLKKILTFYKKAKHPPTSVVLVGHSMVDNHLSIQNNMSRSFW